MHNVNVCFQRLVVRAPTRRHEVSVSTGSPALQVLVSASTRVGEGPPSTPVTLNPTNTGKVQILVTNTINLTV